MTLSRSLLAIVLLLAFICDNAVSQRRASNRPASTLDQGQLMDKLFKGYNKNAIPKKGVEVYVGLIITGIEVETKTNDIIVDGMTKMKWTDNRLQWTTDAYREETIRIDTEKIWQPDIVVYNSELPGKHAAKVNSVVSNNGTVNHIPPVSMKAECVMDLSQWPYDTQKCFIKFGSWTYDASYIKLNLQKNTADIYGAEYEETTNKFGQWEIEEATLGMVGKQYEGFGSEIYEHILIQITMKRNAPAYLWTAQIPAIILSVMTLVIFILPPAHGEKLLIGGIGLILFLGFVGTAGHAVHYSPVHSPKFVQFVSTQMTLTIVATVVSAIMIFITSEPNGTTMPGPVLKVFTLLGTIFVLPGYCKLARESASRISKKKLSSDDDDLASIGHGQLSAAPQWLLFAGVVDRLLLIVYLAVLCADLFSMFFS